MRSLAALQVPVVGSAPATPPAGQVALYALPDGRVRSKNDAGTETVYAPAAAPLAYSISGTLTAGAGTFRIYNDTGRTWTIVAVRATVAAAPVGGSVIVDVNKNGTTIFGTQSARPTIAAAGTTNKTVGMTVTSVADGDYLTVDVDQVGSTTAGADLVVQITVV